MKNTVVYIIGFIGVGKYTIAKELEKQAGFRVIDNHAFNNLIFPLFRIDGTTKIPDKVWDILIDIRKIFFDAFKEIRNEDFNFVFTNALSEFDSVDKHIYKKFEKDMEEAGSLFIPVRLLIDKEENRKRIVSPEREVRMKQNKDHDLDHIYDNHEVLKPNHPNELEIDVTHISAEQAAKRIIEHIEALQ